MLSIRDTTGKKGKTTGANFKIPFNLIYVSYDHAIFLTWCYAIKRCFGQFSDVLLRIENGKFSESRAKITINLGDCVVFFKECLPPRNVRFLTYFMFLFYHIILHDITKIK